MSRIWEVYIGPRTFVTTDYWREGCNAPGKRGRALLVAEAKRSRGFFKKTIVVHGRTQHWSTIRENEARKWLITLADTRPQPMRGSP